MERAQWRRFVVIPAYNEEESIGQVVRELRAADLRVIVVDDGSTDRTVAVAEAAGADVLRHCLNMGQGMALRTGIDFSLREGAEVIITFDADGQHCARDIDALVKPIEDGVADVALGTRFGGRTVNMPRIRRAVLKLAAAWYRLVNRMSLTDTHNGLRALSRGAAQRIRISQARMAHASEILDQIRASGLRYVEVPVTIVYSERSLRKGQSLWGVSAVLFDLLVRKITQ